MKILCPECNGSVVLNSGEKILDCPHCHLKANLSQIGTSPGVAAAAVTRDMTGEVIGGYQLESIIGLGGMGVVYKATKEGDGDEPVALKILSCESVWKRNEFIERFNREIKALSRLEHPNIVRILDSGTDGDVHYLVTEYVPGESLAERLEKGPLELNEILSVTIGVLDAIAFAHRGGVVHRDIKPANIMLVEGGVKVLDFGLAQISGGDTVLTTLTRTNLAMGTFNYLSPEQRTSAKNVDGRADLFSLGVVLFEMLTGTLPLGNFQMPSRIRHRLDKRFDTVVSKSLAADPDDRYDSAKSFQRELVKLEQNRRVHPGIIVGAAAGIATLAIGVVLAMTGGESDVDADSPQQSDDAQVNTKIGKVQEPVNRTPPPPEQKMPATPLMNLPQVEQGENQTNIYLNNAPAEPTGAASEKSAAGKQKQGAVATKGKKRITKQPKQKTKPASKKRTSKKEKKVLELDQQMVAPKKTVKSSFSSQSATPSKQPATPSKKKNPKKINKKMLLNAKD